jgi:hypothetical protein
LDVNARQWRRESPAKGLDLRGMNVKRIEVITNGSREVRSRRNGTFQLEWSDFPKNAIGKGDVESTSKPINTSRAYGPMIRLLATSAPFTIVAGKPNLLHLAKRIVHDIYLYHRTDSEIIDEWEALQRVACGTIGEGSLVVLGRPEENQFAAWMIAEKRVPRVYQ